MEHHAEDDINIDLIGFALHIWEAKYEILCIGAVIGAAAFGYGIYRGPNLDLQAQIKPITVAENDRYTLANALGGFQVNSDVLQSLYITQLETADTFVEALHKHEVLDRDEFDTDEEYEEAAFNQAHQLVVLYPSDLPEDERKPVAGIPPMKYPTLRYDGCEQRKPCVELFATLNELTNEAVRQIILKRFDTDKEVRLHSIARQQEDLAQRRQNILADYQSGLDEFEMAQRFALEDVDIAIANALVDYERNTINRLAFLSEQAAIARASGISKNTLDVQPLSAGGSTDNAQSSPVAVLNVQTEVPFYHRGYEAIEKEIELIAARVDTHRFVGNLVELETSKRTLLQDTTLARAEARAKVLASIKELDLTLRGLDQDKSLLRSERYFELSPINQPNFLAVDLQPVQFTDSSRSPFLLGGALGTIGLVFGALLALIRRAVKQRLDEEEKQLNKDPHLQMAAE